MLAEELRRFRTRAASHADPSLSALLDAADEVVLHWRASCDELDGARRALQETAAAEREVRARLATLLDLIRDCGGTAAPSPSPPSAEAGEAPAIPASLPSTPPSGALAPSPSGVETPASRGGRNGAPAAGPPPRRVADVGIPTAPEGPCRLRILLFGRLRFDCGSGPVEPDLNGKALKVLLYLLAHRARPTPTEVLLESFWPGTPPGSARRSLHQAIYNLRKATRDLDPRGRLVVFRDDAYQLDPDLDAWCDVQEFDRLVDAGRRAHRDGDAERATVDLRRAMELPAADYLADAPYEDWALAERERLRLRYIDAGNRLAGLLEDSGNPRGALDVSHRVLEVESCDEVSHRRIMRCELALGRPVLALRQYDRCVDALSRTYGLEPSPATHALHRRIVDGAGRS